MVIDFSLGLGSVISAFVIAFMITVVFIPKIIIVAHLKHLFDEPDYRKTHKRKTPTLGGLAIFSGLIISYSLFKDFYDLLDVKYLVPALIIIFFAGIKDDILVLTPFKKLLAQFLAAFLIVVVGNIKINSFYGLFGVQEIPYLFSVIFTIAVIIAIINCYNLIDGLDGLAGVLGIVAAVSFGCWFYLTYHWSMVFLSFALVGSLVGFLVYNWQPAKIFMGDTGAMIIGFIVAVLSIHFIELNKAKSIAEEYWIHASPSVAMAVMGIPIFDMLKVFVYRLIRRKSPFNPDRTHLHHIFTDLGFSHWQTTVVLGLWNTLVVLFAFYNKDFKSSVLLVCLVLFISVPSVLLHIYRNKKLNVKV